MLKKHPQFTFGFAIVFFAELITTANDLKELRLISKPLITISLILFLYYTITLKSRFTSKIVTGLFFSLLGDVFLIFAHLHQIYFMLGLGAFLIAHLFYISAFYLDSTNKIEVQKRYVLPIFIVFGFFCISYYYFIRSHLGGMNIPVLLYSFVITMMGIMAALRYGKTNSKSFAWVLVGAIFFIMSDSILAYNKFVRQIEGGDLLIMSTYMLAQFFITMGTVERKFVKKN